MLEKIDTRRVVIFVAIAFGWSYAAGLLVWQMGGLFEARPLISEALNSFTVIVALLYMPGPAVAHILTRLITREGWQDTKLRPSLHHGRWKYWLVGWLGTAVLLVIGGVAFYAIYPQNLDPTMSEFAKTTEQALADTGQPLPMSIQMLALAQVVAGMSIGILFNAPLMLGEEFGWRAYLQPKLMPLGARRAMLIMGVVWGLWHAPIIWMGYNYGSFNGNEYPGAPWSGVLMMCWMTFVVGTFLGWVTYKGQSVWPAVIGHAVINGLAAGVLFFFQGEMPVLIGPTATGVLGSLGFTLFTLWSYLSPNAWRTEKTAVGLPSA